MFEFVFTALQATLGDVNAAIDRLLQQRLQSHDEM